MTEHPERRKDGTDPATDRLPARGYRWPPFEAGNLKAVTHGARSPRLVSARAAEVRDQVAALPWVAESDGLAVDALCSCVARYYLLSEYVEKAADEHGVESVAPTVLTEVTRAESNMWKAFEQLGLTPAGRARLAKDLGIATHYREEGVEKAVEAGRRLRGAR